MFKKLRKTFKKDSIKNAIETDSTPDSPRICVATPIPILQEKIPENNLLGQGPILNEVAAENQIGNISHSGHKTSFSTEHSSLHTFPLSPYAQSVPFIQLSVTNSHGFHIGDVQNVTVSSGGSANFNSTGSGLSSLGKSLNDLKTSLSPSYPTDHLENICDKIKDWEVSLISEHIGDRWREFGEGLHIASQDLIDLEAKNPGKPKEATMEMLRNFLNVFPDTSIGFIAAVLRETGHFRALEHLAKLRS